jgi:hypothetical protein
VKPATSFFETQPIKAHFARAEVAKPTEVSDDTKAAAELAGLPKVRRYCAEDAFEAFGERNSFYPPTSLLVIIVSPDSVPQQPRFITPLLS